MGQCWAISEAGHLSHPVFLDSFPTHALGAIKPTTYPSLKVNTVEPSEALALGNLEWEHTSNARQWGQPFLECPFLRIGRQFLLTVATIF